MSAGRDEPSPGSFILLKSGRFTNADPVEFTGWKSSITGLVSEQIERASLPLIDPDIRNPLGAFTIRPRSGCAS